MLELQIPYYLCTKSLEMWLDLLGSPQLKYGLKLLGCLNRVILKQGNISHQHRRLCAVPQSVGRKAGNAEGDSSRFSSIPTLGCMNQSLELAPFSSSYQVPRALSCSTQPTFANTQTSWSRETNPPGARLAAARRPLWICWRGCNTRGWSLLMGSFHPILYIFCSLPV